MLIWNVKLFDRVLISVTDKVTAEGLVGLLNNGTLHGVPGDPAAYEAARAERTHADTLATHEAKRPMTRKRESVVAEPDTGGAGDPA